MLQRAIMLAAVIGAAYWYWSGPYQAKINPSYEAIVKKNDDNMAQCIRASAYALGVTGDGPGASEAQKQCAAEFNVYEDQGHWHRYDMTRPD